MPKKKIATITEEIPNSEEKFDSVEAPEQVNNELSQVDSSYEELMSTLSELGEEDHKVVVYRYNKEKKKYARLEEWGHKEFSLNTLADAYGGGSYRIFVYSSNGRFVTSKIVEIDEAKKPKEQNVPGQGTGQQDLSRIYELLLAQSEKNNALMLGLVEKIFSSTNNYNKVNEGFIKSIDDIINLKQLFNNKSEDPAITVNKLLEVFNRGMEFGTAVSENGTGKESVLESVFKKFLNITPSDKIMSALMPLDNHPKGIEINHLNNTKIPVNQQNTEVKPMTNVLSMMAKINVSPEKIAKTFIESADEFTFNLVINLKDNPSEIEKIVYSFDPNLKNFPSWTKDFIEAVIKNMSQVTSEQVTHENLSK